MDDEIDYARCGRSKPGWMCSREHGHEGPCAAWPVAQTYEQWQAMQLPRWALVVLFAIGTVAGGAAIGLLTRGGL